MIECVFTLDYEVYGDGTGTLKDCVCEPARQLMDTFGSFDQRFVAFVEAAELEKIEEHRTDPATIRAFPAGLRANGVGVVTFEKAYSRLIGQARQSTEASGATLA